MLRPLTLSDAEALQAINELALGVSLGPDPATIKEALRG